MRNAMKDWVTEWPISVTVLRGGTPSSATSVADWSLIGRQTPDNDSNGKDEKELVNKMSSSLKVWQKWSQRHCSTAQHFQHWDQTLPLETPLTGEHFGSIVSVWSERIADIKNATRYASYASMPYSAYYALLCRLCSAHSYVHLCSHKPLPGLCCALAVQHWCFARALAMLWLWALQPSLYHSMDWMSA